MVSVLVLRSLISEIQNAVDQKELGQKIGEHHVKVGKLKGRIKKLYGQQAIRNHKKQRPQYNVPPEARGAS